MPGVFDKGKYMGQTYTFFSDIANMIMNGMGTNLFSSEARPGALGVWMLDTQSIQVTSR